MRVCSGYFSDDNGRVVFGWLGVILVMLVGV